MALNPYESPHFEQTPYYTFDVTHRSYRAILGGGGLRWPLFLRVIFAFRKALGWHFPAASARAKPAELMPLTLDQLPKSIQSRLWEQGREASELGYRDLVCMRSQTIGHYVSYAYMMINADRATTYTTTAFRLAVGKTVKEGWATSLRTDFVDDSVLATSKGETRGLPTELIPGKFHLETLPLSASTGELVRRHQERLAGIEREKIKFIPESDVMTYLLNGAQRDFDQLINTGLFRRISAEEVERLRNVEFDFPN